MNKEQRTQLLCQNVKFLREQNGLTIKEMAQILDIPLASMKKLEDGILTKRVRVDIVYRIDCYFNVGPKELLSTSLK